MRRTCKNLSLFLLSNNKYIQLTFYFWSKSLFTYIHTCVRKKVFRVSNSPPVNAFTKWCLLFCHRQLLGRLEGFGRVGRKYGRKCHFSISEWHVSTRHATPRQASTSTNAMALTTACQTCHRQVPLLHHCNANGLKGKWCLHFKYATAVRSLLGAGHYQFSKN